MNKIIEFDKSDSGKTESERFSKNIEIETLESTAIAENDINSTLELTSSIRPSENQLNRKRLSFFKEKYTSKFFQVLNEQDFEYGYTSNADRFVRELMQQNRVVTKEWLNSILVDFFDNIKIVVGLLQVVSHLEYNEIYPEGITMALSATSHNNVEVRECGIRSFENWANAESLRILKNLSFAENWMQDYVDQVIADIEEEIAVNVIAR